MYKMTVYLFIELLSAYGNIINTLL